jgi:DUF4097 and DUF4098 domain-containing protein YvlB/uncharacterized membrane protein HdeD (DUF308 family)
MASAGKKKKWLLLVGLVLLAGGLVFAIIPGGGGLAELLMRLWPVFLVCAGVVRVMGYAVERKPRSPVGGMLLIIIGVLFFASRFHSDLNALQVYGRYWLVLLIIYAAVELLRFYSHRSTEGPPPRLFTFWKVAVVLLIVTTGVLANRVSNNPSVLSALRLPGFLGGIRDSVVGQEYSFTDPAFAASTASGIKVVVNNSYGNVKVTGGASGLRATLTKGVRAWSEDDARKIAEQIRLIVNQTSDGFRISTNRDQVNQQFTTDIQIEVPRSVELAITGSYGAVSVNGIDGELGMKVSYGRAETNNIVGDVSAVLSYSDLDAANISGDLRVSGAKNARVSQVSGALELNASNGQIELRNLGGPVEVSAAFSKITAQDLTSWAEIKTEHGGVKVLRALDVAIEAPFSDVRADNIAGNLHISSSQSEVQFHSISGEVVVTAQQSSVTGDDLRGSVEIETSHGAVNLKNFYEGIRVSTSYRDVTLVAAAEPVGDIVVDNSHGEIKLTIPLSSEFQLDASSESGQVRSVGFREFPQNARDSLLAVVGDGPRIKLKTSYKNITIQANASRQAQS